MSKQIANSELVYRCTVQCQQVAGFACMMEMCSNTFTSSCCLNNCRTFSAPNWSVCEKHGMWNLRTAKVIFAPLLVVIAVTMSSQTCLDQICTHFARVQAVFETHPLLCLWLADTRHQQQSGSLHSSLQPQLGYGTDGQSLCGHSAPRSFDQSHSEDHQQLYECTLPSLFSLVGLED